MNITRALPRSRIRVHEGAPHMHMDDICVVMPVICCLPLVRLDVRLP
jgi:hypothetical protein